MHSEGASSSLEGLKEAAPACSEARAQRVAELTRLVQAGRYRVSKEQIADAIIAHLLLLQDLAAGFAAAGSRLDDFLPRNEKMRCAGA